jgi:NADPH-dependent ferric siderophore reductase
MDLRVQRIRHETKRRDLVVSRTEYLSPNVRSVTFQSDSLSDFVSASFDDHIKLFLDNDVHEAVRRDYTPRHLNPAAREITIEFSLHSDGPAATWAAQASAGQRVSIGGPRGSFVIPSEFDWHLLAGDETALPAIARRLEELPIGKRVIVLLHVADVEDRRELQTVADVNVQWFSLAEELIDAVRLVDLPKGEGYAWCAGEAHEMSKLRSVLVHERGLNPRSIRAAAYWKRGVASHHENLEG